MLSVYTIAIMIDSFISECENALKKTTTMKEKLSNYKQANTIFGLLGKSLTEFLSLHIKNRNEVTLGLRRTTQRLRTISFVTLGAILFGCLGIGLFFANHIAEAIYLEISERKDAEEHARHLVHHDQLTNLPNRRHFEIFLKERIAIQEELSLALLFIDLDGFMVALWRVSIAALSAIMAVISCMMSNAWEQPKK